MNDKVDSNWWNLSGLRLARSANVGNLSTGESMLLVSVTFSSFDDDDDDDDGDDDDDEEEEEVVVLI